MKGFSKKKYTLLKDFVVRLTVNVMSVYFNQY